jgi:hypothetical protein
MQADCAACVSGEQHRSHVLYGRHNGRRFAVYVQEDVVGEVRRNRRALQDVLMQAGPRQSVEARAAKLSEPRNGKYIRTLARSLAGIASWRFVWRRCVHSAGG